MPLGDHPILRWVINAARGAELVDEVVVATSTEESDYPIVEYCRREDVRCYRGGLEDVLDRYYQVALFYKPTHIVRLTADCPLLKTVPKIVDLTILSHLLHNYDYTTNRPVFPSGLDVEVFSMNTLTRAAKVADEQYQREHVTPFMQNERYFRVGRYEGIGADEEEWWSKDRKYSIDTREEYEHMRGMVGCSKSQTSY